jgi:hypothetical protein
MATRKVSWNEKVINETLVSAYARMISHKKGREIFKKWETANLKSLTQTTKSYKIGNSGSDKGKTLVRLPRELRQDLVEKWETELELSGPFSELSKADIVNLMLGQMIKGESLSSAQTNSDAHCLRFLHPDVADQLKNSLNSYLEERDKAQTTKVKATELEFVQSAISAKVIAHWIANNLDVKQTPDDTFDELAPFFNALQRNNPFVWDALCETSFDQDSIDEAVSIVSDATGDQIPSGREEYFAVLRKPFDLGGKGFAADIVAVQGGGGSLIPITQDHAVQLFPSKGSAFISLGLLKGIPGSCEYFPAKLVRSSTGGLNEYRVEEQWNGVAEIIQTESGLHQIETLQDELKALSLKNTSHPIWFKMPDGALISPKTRRDQIITTSFKENWHYIGPNDVPTALVNKGYVRQSLLSEFDFISMAPDGELLAELSKIERQSSNEPTPSFLSNRLDYMIAATQSNTASVSSFIKSFLRQFEKSEAVQDILNDEIKQFASEHAPKLDEMSVEATNLQNTINKLQEQLENRKKQIDRFEKDVKARVQKAVDKSAQNLTSLLDDPVINMILRTQPPANGSTPSATSPVTTLKQYQLPILALSKKTEKRATYKATGLRILSENAIEGLYSELIEFTASGATPMISGPGSFLFASQALATAGYAECQVAQLLFAESIAEAQKALISNTERGTLILPSTEVDHDVLANELTLRAELGNPGGTPSIIVQANLTKVPTNSVVKQFLTPVLANVDPAKPITEDDIADFYDNAGVMPTRLETSLIRRMPDLLKCWYLESLKSAE